MADGVSRKDSTGCTTASEMEEARVNDRLAAHRILDLSRKRQHSQPNSVGAPPVPRSHLWGWPGVPASCR